MPWSICITICMCISQLFGSQTPNKEKEQSLVVPSEDVYVVIASQHGCPIEFIRAYRVGFLSGGGKDVYKIRNRAAKSIKSYTIAIVNSESTGTENSVSISNPAAYFRPGEIRSNDKNLSIIPLTEQIRQNFNLNGEMKVVKIFIVVHVEFSDGSEYNAEPAYKSLKRFIEQNPTNGEPGSSQKVKRR